MQKKQVLNVSKKDLSRIGASISEKQMKNIAKHTPCAIAVEKHTVTIIWCKSKTFLKLHRKDVGLLIQLLSNFHHGEFGLQ